MGRYNFLFGLFTANFLYQFNSQPPYTHYPLATKPLKKLGSGTSLLKPFWNPIKTPKRTSHPRTLSMSPRSFQPWSFQKNFYSQKRCDYKSLMDSLLQPFCISSKKVAKLHYQLATNQWRSYWHCNLYDQTFLKTYERQRERNIHELFSFHQEVSNNKVLKELFALKKGGIFTGCSRKVM